LNELSSTAEGFVPLPQHDIAPPYHSVFSIRATIREPDGNA
jgi:hypothetical protein